MTAAVASPPPPAPPRPARRPPTPLQTWVQAAAPAALWAAGAGLVATVLPVLLVWAADPRSGAGASGVLRTAGAVWLVAHGTPLPVAGGRVALLPLGLLLVPLLLLLRGGGAAARAAEVATLRAAAGLTAVLAAQYGSLAAAVAVLSAQGPVVPAPLAALACAGTVALVGAGAGVLRAAGLGGALWRAVPSPLRRLLAPAAAVTASLLAAGALLAGVRLAVELPRAAELAGAGAPGVVGGLGLLVVGLALAPSAAVWGAAWWAGPGFAVGSGTVVSPFAVTLGPVPALPALAALPGGALPAGVAVLTLLVPLGAGAVGGRLLLRGGADRPVRDAVLCGLLAGVLVGVSGWLSAGSVGGERLAHVGPSAWQLALAVGAQAAVGATLAVRLGAWTARLPRPSRLGRRRRAR